MTSFHSPLSIYLNNVDLSQYITQIDTGAGTFHGILPPEAIEQLLSTVEPTPRKNGKRTKAKGHTATTTIRDEVDRHRWQDLIDEAAPTPVDGEQELTDWWLTRAAAEIERTVPKAVEYGADDLIDIGRELCETMDFDPDLLGPARLAELGVYFYLIGKISRWKSAIRRGDQVSDDTLFDIGVYIRMAQRIRFAGGWPGLKETK